MKRAADVTWRRRSIPLAIMSVLTLGAGLGVGLGLSEGPLTVASGASGVVAPCVAIVGPTTTTVSCTRRPDGPFSTAVRFQFTHLPPVFHRCLVRAMQGLVDSTPRNEKAVKSKVRILVRACGYQGF
jgi:hypothetical protein